MKLPYGWYQIGYSSMVYKVRDKKTGPGASSRVGAYVNKVLAQDLQKKWLKNSKLLLIMILDIYYVSYMSSQNMLQLNQGKIKRAKTDLHGFIGARNQSKRKPNQLWVD